MDKEKAKLLIQKIQASKLMLDQIEKELKDFLGVESIEEPVYRVTESWLGDDGKEYFASQPYIKAKQWYCCGRPLTKEVQDGKTYYICNSCHSKYSA